MKIYFQESDTILHDFLTVKSTNDLKKAFCNGHSGAYIVLNLLKLNIGLLRMQAEQTLPSGKKIFKLYNILGSVKEKKIFKKILCKYKIKANNIVLLKLKHTIIIPKLTKVTCVSHAVVNCLQAHNNYTAKITAALFPPV